MHCGQTPIICRNKQASFLTAAWRQIMVLRLTDCPQRSHRQQSLGVNELGAVSNAIGQFEGGDQGG